MKKREKKLQDKQEDKYALNDEDKEIVKQVKNKKRDERRQRNKTFTEEEEDPRKSKKNLGKRKNQKEQMGGTDEFDHLLEKYQNKILKKIKSMPKGESGAAYEEVDVSD